jgi:hypothetical protein
MIRALALIALLLLLADAALAAPKRSAGGCNILHPTDADCRGARAALLAHGSHFHRAWRKS